MESASGRNGLAAAGDVKIKFTNCTTEDHAKIYRLVRSFDDELIECLHLLAVGWLRNLVRNYYVKYLYWMLGQMFYSIHSTIQSGWV